MDEARQSDATRSSPALLGCAVAATILLLVCCVTPPILTRLTYGRWGESGDISQVKPGMTPEEVIELLGPPHDRDRWDNCERWIYREGYLGLPTHGISFQDGVVLDWYVV
jgi:outer membrane protein assembly factor BamE (lipoprotein component of BamABCDE complex)